MLESAVAGEAVAVVLAEGMGAWAEALQAGRTLVLKRWVVMLGFQTAKSAGICPHSPGFPGGLMR